MQIYLDTADLNEIRSAKKLGVLRGVTTNPSHMYKAGHPDPREAIQQICHTSDVPTSMEVTTVDHDAMIAQAREFATWSPNVVVKLPTTREGLKAMAIFSRERHTATCRGCPHLPGCPIRDRYQREGTLEREVPVNATVIFSAGQAVAAASAGASYVSPFVGRLDSIGQDGLRLVRDIAEIFRAHHAQAHIISAAARNPIHAVESWKAGAQIVTMASAILDQLLTHPLTDQAVELFMQDAARLEAMRRPAAE